MSKQNVQKQILRQNSVLSQWLARLSYSYLRPTLRPTTFLSCSGKVISAKSYLLKWLGHSLSCRRSYRLGRRSCNLTSLLKFGNIPIYGNFGELLKFTIMPSMWIIIGYIVSRPLINFLERGSFSDKALINEGAGTCSTTSFQRSNDIVLTLWTLYGRWNDTTSCAYWDIWVVLYSDWVLFCFCKQTTLIHVFLDILMFIWFIYFDQW